MSTTSEPGGAGTTIFGRGRRARGRRGSPAAGTPLAALLLCLLLLPAASGPVSAQDPLQERIRESEERLEQIRSERRQLQAEMESLGSRVSTVSEELENLERQIGSSSSAIAELDIQVQALNRETTAITSDMLRTRDVLTARKMELRQRLRTIYKRGPLASIRVLLAAESFSDLINRYKYLHLVSLYDRMLVRQVSRLEGQLDRQRDRLTLELERLRSLRRQKRQELQELENLESRREQRLADYRVRESRVATRFARLASDAEKQQELLAELERARRENERRTGTSSTSSLRTADLGQLGWPVEGPIVYEFGPERREGISIQREGIGIGAERGTPVRVVESGRVELAGPRGSFGPSVIVSHGGGYYSVYHYLEELRVRTGDRVEDGEVLGSVGGAGSREGPHIEFQIHEPSSGGDPQPVDPVRWLRERS